MKLSMVVVAVIFSILPLGVFGEELRCLDCHDDKTKGAFVHTPLTGGDCTSCHESIGKPHPGKTGGFRLAADGTKLCLMCHDDPAAKKYPHAPAQGDCTLCHRPHSSPYRFQLRETGVALCFSCHESSSFGGKSIHEPVALGQCTSCHSPHGTDHPRLLLHPFPEELYLPYNDQAYILCTTCHSRDLARHKRTATETGFRNGDRNLHYVHVNNQTKGRSCKVCHAPHASGQHKLLREKVTGFGKWEIPIAYTKTSTGGTCIVGCHKPQSYDREAPAAPVQ